MRLSLQVHYAICGVFDLAYNGHGVPVRVRAIGERQGIPARYLEQIFQRLRKAQLVDSKRGPGGGYTLAREPADISLRDVVEAVEGPIGGPRGEGVGEFSGHRPDFLWPELAGRLAAVLEETDLRELCQRAARASVQRAGADTYTYQI